MDLKIRVLQLTLENETTRNIKLIAEGHMDLNRKLDEALKIDNEKRNPYNACQYIGKRIKKTKRTN